MHKCRRVCVLCQLFDLIENYLGSADIAHLQEDSSETRQEIDVFGALIEHLIIQLDCQDEIFVAQEMIHDHHDNSVFAR